LLQRQDEEAAATPTADESRAAFEQGQEAYASGRYEEAIRQFEAAMGAPGLSTEDLADLVWNMALCRARMGDEHGAMTDAMTYGQYQLAHQTELVLAIRSIIHGPSEEERGSVEAGMPQTADEARSAFQQGQEAYASGRYEEAIRQFEAAMGAPDLGTEGMADLIWNMALCRAHLGDEDGAMTDAMTYGQYGPAHQDDLIRAITSIIHGSAQEEAGGVAGMPQTDEEARAEFELGREAHDSGRYAEALRHFEAAIGAPGLDPSRMPDLIWNTALARARLGDQDGAMTDAMTYGEYRPNQEELIRLIRSIINGPSEREAEGGNAVAGE
jgi:Tfp pilus assembly protein PilF